jgi:hypothetical protein
MSLAHQPQPLPTSQLSQPLLPLRRDGKKLHPLNPDPRPRQWVQLELFPSLHRERDPNLNLLPNRPAEGNAD